MIHSCSSASLRCLFYTFSRNILGRREGGLDPLFESRQIQLGASVLPGFCEVLWLGATVRALPKGRTLGRLSLLCHAMSDSRLASPALGMGTSGIPGLTKTHCLAAENCGRGLAALTCSPAGLHAGLRQLPRATGWYGSREHSFLLKGGQSLHQGLEVRGQAVEEFCTELFLPPPSADLEGGPDCNTEATYSCLSN